jgi:zinc transporter
MSDEAESEEFITGYLLDGRGGCREIGPQEIEGWKPADGILWVHVDRSSERGKSWLRSEQCGLPPHVCDALLIDEIRPRTLVVKDGVMAVLRGVNLNEGADEEDMVSLRLWVDEHRVVDLRHHKLRELSDVRDRLALGLGPRSTGDLLLELAQTMVDRMDPVVDHLEGEVTDLELELEPDHLQESRETLSSIRRRTIRLRRYLAPQRDALTRLRVEAVSWKTPQQEERLRELVERITHTIEDLDWVREHAGVAQDELAGMQSEAARVAMYRIAIITGVLLPPSLLVGLLGANVSGIPGGDSPLAFPLLCLGILMLTFGELLYLRRIKWL